MANFLGQFAINRGHPLCQGLVYAGLGRHPGARHYHDSSLFRKDGTRIGTGTSIWVPGPHFWAQDFNGTDDYINVQGMTTQPVNDLTFSFWFAPDVSGVIKFAGKMVDGFTDGWFLYLSSSAAYFYIDASSANVYTTSLGLTAGTWHNLVVRKRYADSYAEMFLDGASISVITPTAKANTPLDSTADLNIGRKVGTLGGYWNGKAGDVRVYDKPLTAAEIGELFYDPGSIVLQPRKSVFFPEAAGGRIMGSLVGEGGLAGPGGIAGIAGGIAG